MTDRAVKTKGGCYFVPAPVADRIEELEAIVEKLPKTADGVPVVPGMEVFHYFLTPPGVCVIDVATVGVAGDACCDWRDESGTPTGDVFDCNMLYSTRAAAEAAKEGARR